MPGEDPFPLDLLLEPPPDVLPRLLTRWLGLPGDERPATPSMELPDALATGLSTLARWPGAFRQTVPRSVDAVDAVAGLGRFLHDSQGRSFWGFALADADLADPRVWIEDALDGRRIADPRTSRFLLKMTLLELVLGGTDRVAGPVPSAAGTPTADELVADLTRLVGLGPLTWPTTCWFYAGRDELAMSMDGITGRRDWAWRAGRPRVPAAVG
jgi:hypothetical protein